MLEDEGTTTKELRVIWRWTVAFTLHGFLPQTVVKQKIVKPGDAFGSEKLDLSTFLSSWDNNCLHEWAAVTPMTQSSSSTHERRQKVGDQSAAPLSFLWSFTVVNMEMNPANLVISEPHFRKDYSSLSRWILSPCFCMVLTCSWHFFTLVHFFYKETTKCIN